MFRRHSIICSLVLMLLLWSSNKCTAQTLALQHFTIESGFPSSEVYDCLQDKEGFMWFATDRGVVRYDGFEFKTYTTADGLTDNVVFRLYQRDEKIWFITYNLKLSYFLNDSIHTYAYNNLIQESKNDLANLILSFQTDEMDNVHISAKGIGYLLIDANGKGTITSPNEKKTDAYRTQIEIINGHAFILPVLNYLTQGKYEIWYENQSVYIGERIIFEERIRTGVTKYTAETGIWLSHDRSFYFLTNDSTELFIKMPSTIISYFETEDEIYIGTYENGVFVVNKKTKEIRLHLLKENSVTSILPDNQGGLWFSTLDDGCFYSANPNMVVYNKDNGLIDNSITSLGSDGKNRTLGGDAKGTVYIFEKGDLYYTNKAASREKPYFVSSIAHNPFSDEFFISQAGSMVIKDTAYIKEKSQIYLFRYCLPLSKNKILFSHIGIYIFQKDQKVNYETYEGITGKFIFPASDHEFWLQDEKGFFYINTESGVTIDYTARHPELRYRIVDIRQTKDGSICIATRGGGLVLLKDDELTVYRTEDGMASDQLVNCYVDPKGNIWVTSNSGLNCIDTNGEILTYSVQQGLPSNEITSCTSDSNFLWIGTKKGLCKLPLAQLDVRQDAPALINVIYSTPEGKSQTNPKSIELSHKNSNFQLELFMLNYKYGGKINYRYRLLPNDDEWIASNNRTVNFTQLASGEYTLEINAKGNYGAWNKEVQRITIVVNTPFWQEWYFVLITVLLVIVPTVYFYQLRSNRLKVKYALEQEVEAHRRQALAAQMNPHFIFNALNSIQSYIARGDKKQSIRFLAKFAKLVRLTLANSQKLEVPISQEMDLLTFYLQLESIRFEQLTYSIKIDESINESNTLIPTLMLQPCVENAIWHGLMHKEEGGHISIVLTKKDNLIQCTIEDNGIGRKKAEAINTDKTHQSFSTSITQKRLKALGKQMHSNFQLIIEDLEKDGVSMGTRATFHVPLKTLDKND